MCASSVWCHEYRNSILGMSAEVGRISLLFCNPKLQKEEQIKNIMEFPFGIMVKMEEQPWGRRLLFSGVNIFPSKSHDRLC